MSEMKKQILIDYLSQGKTIIHLNGCHKDVKLPSHLQNKYDVGLSLSYKFASPTNLNDDCVETILTFNGKPFEVLIPYDAIFSIELDMDSNSLELFMESLPDQMMFKKEILLSLISQLFGEHEMLKANILEKIDLLNDIAKDNTSSLEDIHAFCEEIKNVLNDPKMFFTINANDKKQ